MKEHVSLFITTMHMFVYRHPCKTIAGTYQTPFSINDFTTFHVTYGGCFLDITVQNVHGTTGRAHGQMIGFVGKFHKTQMVTPADIDLFVRTVVSIPQDENGGRLLNDGEFQTDSIPF